MLLIHIPFLIRIYPMTTFIISAAQTIVYTGSIGSAVKVQRTYASGTENTHENTLSKRNVTNVFPPERRVKYIALR